jgi:hypothetical protein
MEDVLDERCSVSPRLGHSSKVLAIRPNYHVYLIARQMSLSSFPSELHYLSIQANLTRSKFSNLRSLS